MRNSLLAAPLSGNELHALRELSKMGRTFETLCAASVRWQFMRAALGVSLGRAGERGVTLVERATLLLAIAHPAEDVDEIRWKALLARCHVVPAEDDPIVCMLCAGIEADCRRLGLLVEDLGTPDLDAVPH